MSVKVFYELWQMECCGTPFKLGDSIDWLVMPAKGIKLSEVIEGLDYYYEAHSDDWENIFVLKGRVEDISIFYEKYELVEGEPHNMKVPVPDINENVKTDSSHIDEKERGDLKAAGYIVEICDTTVRPARKEEVTFC